MINLLPPEIQKKQLHRKTLIILTAVQLFIFLCLGSAAFFMHAREQQAITRSAELTHRLAAMDTAPTAIAEALHDIQHRNALFEQYITDNIPAYFYPGWLTAIMQVESPGIFLEALEFTGGYIIVHAIARDMAYIADHRRDLALFFYPVVLGRMERQLDDSVWYELRIIVD